MAAHTRVPLIEVAQAQASQNLNLEPPTERRLNFEFNQYNVHTENSYDSNLYGDVSDNAIGHLWDVADRYMHQRQMHREATHRYHYNEREHNNNTSDSNGRGRKRVRNPYKK